MEAKPDTVASALSRLGLDNAPADRVAAMAAEAMHAIHAALAPIIGEGGVSALYRRSLFLTRRDVAWVEAMCGETGENHSYATLQAALARLPAGEALGIAEALFANLYTVLVSLIGTALTQRLLHPMFNTPSNGDAVQEIPHE